MQYLEDYIFVVSGLPRSGTSLMMSIVQKIGIPLLVDNIREADINNPKGFFEYEPVKTIYKNENSWFEDAKGKCLKIISPLLPFIPNPYLYKVLFIKRDINEIINSQSKMRNHQNNKDFNSQILFEKYTTHIDSLEQWFISKTNIQVTYFDYNCILDRNISEIEKFNQLFSGFGITVNNDIYNLIDDKLYRNRVKKDRD